MAATTGHILLFIAILVLLTQLVLPGKYYFKAACTLFFTLITAFVCLIISYVISDFSVLNVYNNSHTAKPLLYKITGSWGNHEGSMLLLCVILSCYNLALANYNRKIFEKKLNNVSSRYHETAYIIQLLLTAGFLLFLSLTSNPFIRIFPTPEQGLGLNPLLQDIGLALHPPTLYAGYMGFSICFSAAVAALLECNKSKNKEYLKEILSDWLLLASKFINFSLSFLTLGIALGSWWAYRELGWGGFWFWDPVENASLMPWLAGIGLLHCLILCKKRNLMHSMALFMAIFAFILSLIGIFLVRSGIVSSVHAFATDPTRGIFILIFLSIVGIFSLSIFTISAGKLSSIANPKLDQKQTKSNILSRELLLKLNNLFFITLAATVLLGTLYPIFYEIFTQQHLSVGAPYYNINFNIIALITLFFTALASSIQWSAKKTISIGKLLIKLLPAIILSIIASLYPFLIIDDALTANLLAVIAIFLGFFLLFSCILPIINFSKISAGKLSWNKLPNHSYNMLIAHAGCAVLLLGISLSTALSQTNEMTLKLDETHNNIVFGDFSAKLISGKNEIVKNYVKRSGVFRIYHKEAEIAVLAPEIRIYPNERSTTIEAAIYYNLFSNIYVTIGEIDEAGKNYAVRASYKPMINLIWFGAVLIAFGMIRNKWKPAEA